MLQEIKKLKLKIKIKLNNGATVYNKGWSKDSFFSDGIMPDTQYIKYPDGRTDLYIKYDKKNSYWFQKTIEK